MIPAEKQILRARLKAELAIHPDKPGASLSLRRHLEGSEQWHRATVIYGFAPLASEPDWLGPEWPPDKILAFPRMEGGAMSFWTARSLSAPGAMGVREPEGGQPAPPPDLILVPGLAFDRGGHRLGRGGGYYDRWLASAPAAFRLGVCFSRQVVEALPRETHDCPVEAVLTENGMVVSV
jgi:5-formyltetrahydrofolate cyclo-ligase